MELSKKKKSLKTLKEILPKKETDVADFDPDVALGQCISCHGGDLTGTAMAPGLVGTDLSKDELVDVIQNGIPGTAMPGNLVPAEHVDQLAEYILTLK